MKKAWIGLFLSLAASASALPLLWDCPIESAARSLPVTARLPGVPNPQVLLTTRFDGTVKALSSEGILLHSIARDQWLEGCVAVTPGGEANAPVYAYQDSTGVLVLTDLQSGSSVQTQLEGEPRIGTAPCFADLGSSRAAEVIVTRRNGVVTAFNQALLPLWQFDSGSSFDASPSAAPVYSGGSAVYVQSADGIVHALTGYGAPMWRFAMDHPSPSFPSLADPLVVYLGIGPASVLASDREGILYALDTLDGRVQWRAHVGGGALGTPAIVEAGAVEDRRIVVLSERGTIAILDARGRMLSQSALPPGHYVPRPLVADVDGDGEPELLTATKSWSILVSTLDGATKDQNPLQGNAEEGLVLSDLNGDGLLELLAATDCGKAYCFATKARTGWKHPRADSAFSGCVPPIVAAPGPLEERLTPRTVRVRRVTVTDYVDAMPFATAVIDLTKPRQAVRVKATIRLNGRVVGAVNKALEAHFFAAPFIQSQPGLLSLDVSLYDARDRLLGTTTGMPIRPNTPRPLELTGPESMLGAVAARAGHYNSPTIWPLPTVGGKDSWSVVGFMPERWREYGLDREPFVAEAIPRVVAPASAPLGPSHPAWDAMKKDDKPFFVLNDFFRPGTAYRPSDYAALLAMAGNRFLGFQVHEWAYAVWKNQLETASPPPETRAHATDILKNDFRTLLNLTYGKIYAGEGYCLFHHQAYAWGAPMCYAEVGENIPCAPLQFAFIRGAARENGNRPWGAYVSNWFRGTVVDTRYREGEPSVRWEAPDIGQGPNCGHSANLEFRLEMAAHLAGATFVHHESDAYNGSIFAQETSAGSYALSDFGAAIKDWFTYAHDYPERGIPYAPLAFVVDFDHGWRPRENIYGIWPPSRADRSMEALFAQVYPWGRLDFEQGYLANGPYGDIGDVLTNHASGNVLNRYGILWPVGAVRVTDAFREQVVNYIEQGGILVVDRAFARHLPHRLVGVRFDSRTEFATQIQSALGAIPPITAPYRYHPMTLGRSAQALAWTETGAPLVAWQSVGQGLIIVSGTEHWLDEREHLLPLVDALLKPMTDAFLPVSVTGDAEMLLNRTAKGWVIGLINNRGITKTPTQTAIIHADAGRDCLLQFKDDVILSFTARMGKVEWDAEAGGLSVHLAPGAVAVVEVRLSHTP